MRIPFFGGKKKLGDIVVDNKPKHKKVKPQELSGTERMRLRNRGYISRMRDW